MVGRVGSGGRARGGSGGRARAGRVGRGGRDVLAPDPTGESHPATPAATGQTGTHRRVTSGHPAATGQTETHRRATSDPRSPTTRAGTHRRATSGHPSGTGQTGTHPRATSDPRSPTTQAGTHPEPHPATAQPATTRPDRNPPPSQIRPIQLAEAPANPVRLLAGPRTLTHHRTDTPTSDERGGSGGAPKGRGRAWREPELARADGWPKAHLLTLRALPTPGGFGTQSGQRPETGQ